MLLRHMRTSYLLYSLLVGRQRLSNTIVAVFGKSCCKRSLKLNEKISILVMNLEVTAPDPYYYLMAADRLGLETRLAGLLVSAILVKGLATPSPINNHGTGNTRLARVSNACQGPSNSALIRSTTITYLTDKPCWNYTRYEYALFNCIEALFYEIAACYASSLVFANFQSHYEVCTTQYSDLQWNAANSRQDVDILPSYQVQAPSFHGNTIRWVQFMHVTNNMPMLYHRHFRSIINL